MGKARAKKASVAQQEPAREKKPLEPRERKLPPMMTRKRPAPAQPTASLYIHHLNDRVSQRKLTRALEALLEKHSPTSIRVGTSLRLRGQAFVLFDSVEAATSAKDDLEGFLLFGKPLNLQYTHFRSDAEVQRSAGADENGETLASHRAARRAEKAVRRKGERTQLEQAVATAVAAEAAAAATAAAALQAQVGAGAPEEAVAAAAVAVPEEYMAPNKILFIQGVPADAAADDLSRVFGVFPGYVEVRTIPTKREIAFVEYIDEASAAVARSGTNCRSLEALKTRPAGGPPPPVSSDAANSLNVSFAKK